jgi:GTPase SAR1 family protein
MSQFLNICLVGCVSAGKSTILNAFFGQDFAQCKIKRTTMIPNIFIESDTNIDDYAEINNIIKDVNERAYNESSKPGGKLNLEDYDNELTFMVEPMEVITGGQVKICMYDIPGLNDARTKDVYYKYLKDNFHKFNIILFVVDIQSGLNTSDEIDIINFLADKIREQKSINKNIKLLTIVNKADDMQIMTDGNLQVLGELGEMFEQTKDTVKQRLAHYGVEQELIGCIPICGLDAHLYRMINKYKDINKISREHILRIGINDEGSKFRRYTEVEQKNKVLDKIKDQNFVNEMIKMSGFYQIEECLNNFIGIRGCTMVSENILYEYRKTPDFKSNNIMQILTSKIYILNQLKYINPNTYSEEMKKLVKQLNTTIFKVINEMKDYINIKKYYDDIIKQIKSNKQLSTLLSGFFDFSIYPYYFVDKCLELVINEFTKQTINFTRFCNYIDFFSDIQKLDLEIIDVVLESIISNPRGSNTFNFTGFNETLTNDLIETFERIKTSEKFLFFLRFFLGNMYTSYYDSNDLITKKLVFRTLSEIQMCEFINDLLSERKIKTSILLKEYCKSLNSTWQTEHPLEVYYCGFI